MAEGNLNHDLERHASLTGVPEGLASADDAAVLGMHFGALRWFIRAHDCYSEDGIQARATAKLWAHGGVWYAHCLNQRDYV
jgi:hypothetical protein